MRNQMDGRMNVGQYKVAVKYAVWQTFIETVI